MSEPQVREIELCILGFGHVTQRFCELVRDRETRLAREHGVRFVITAVGTGSHGSWLDTTGLTPSSILALFRKADDRFPDAERSGTDLIKASGADVLIESTPLTQGGQPAISHFDTLQTNVPMNFAGAAYFTLIILAAYFLGTRLAVRSRL